MKILYRIAMIIRIIFLNVIIIKKGFLVVFYVDLGNLKEFFYIK